MLSSRTKFIALFCILIFTPILFASSDSDQITITTYYPAPAGSYNELRTYSNTYLATDGGRVGVGTTAPGTELDVRGKGVGSAPDMGASDDVGVFTIGGPGTPTLRMGYNDTGNINTRYAWIQSYYSMPLYINQLQNDVILNKDAGNVSIGIASPGTKLDVRGANSPPDAGASSGKGVFTVGGPGAPTLRIGYYDITPGKYSWMQSYSSMPLSINPIGNSVGIGTTAPRGKLDVNGDLFVTGYITTKQAASNEIGSPEGTYFVPVIRRYDSCTTNGRMIVKEAGREAEICWCGMSDYTASKLRWHCLETYRGEGE